MPRLAGFCCNNDVCNNCCKISKKNRKTKTNLLKEWSMCFGGKKCFGIDCSCWLHYFGLVSVTKWGWLQLHVPIVYKLCELEQNNRPQVLEWHAGYPRRLVEIAFSNQIYAHLTHLQIKQKTSFTGIKRYNTMCPATPWFIQNRLQQVFRSFILKINSD